MIVLGLILVLLSVGAGVILFLASDSIDTQTQFELAGYSWGMTPLAMLITGAVVLLLLWLGLALIRGSVKRRRRPAREAKEAERQAKLEESIRADERARAEETHRAALADRDRVRDEEFQARLAERDRERESEFATRQQEAEERARAYERTRLEDEFASRRAGERDERAGAVGAGAVGAGAVGAGAVGVGAGAATASGVESDRHMNRDSDHDLTDGHVTDHTPVATGDDYAHGHAADPDATAMAGEPEQHRDSLADAPAGSSDAVADDSTRVIPADSTIDDGTHEDGTHDDGSHDAGAQDEGTSDDPNHPGYRTVADKIMGRDPADRE